MLPAPLHFRLLLVLVCLLGAAPGLAAQEIDRLDERLALLEERLDEARVDGNIPGIGFILVGRDGVLWSGGFGVADQDSGEPARDTSLFAIGSTTKAFTAALVGSLVEEGRLSWDQPASEVLPAWTLTGREGEAITVRDLLSHRTGYPRMGVLFASGEVAAPRILEVAQGAVPLIDYHQGFLYSNIQYLAAGVVAERLGGAPWERLVETRFFDPLGMTSTTASHARALGDRRRATGYRWDREDAAWQALPPRDLTNIAPAGAIWSNAHDMGRWVRMLLARGVWEDRRLLAAATIEECWKPVTEIAPGSHYGLGWMLHDWRGRKLVEHGGNIDGYSAEVGLLPDEGLGFVMLCNLNAAPLQGQVNTLVWETLLEPLPGDEPASGEDYAPYIGRYYANFGALQDTWLEVLEQDGKLAIDVPGQMVFELRPPDEDGRRAFAITDQIAISFDRNDAGKVVALRLHQGGLDLEAPREGVEIVGQLPRAALEPWLGTYHFEEADMDWTVLIQNERLAIDVPNEMVYELYPPDEEGWRQFRVTDRFAARFETDDEGRPAAMRFRAEGEEIRLPRTGGPDDAPPTLQQVLAHLAIDARREAWDAWQGVTLEGEVAVLQAGVRGAFTWSRTASGAMWSSLDFGEFGSATVAVTADGGWVDSAFETYRELSPREIIQEREQATFSLAAGALRGTYEDLRLEGRRTRDGRDHWVIAGIKVEGPPTELWYDAETGDLMRFVFHIDLDGAGFLPAECQLSDYRVVEGVRLPFRVKVGNPQSGETVMTVTEVRPGEAPAADVFAPPSQPRRPAID